MLERDDLVDWITVGLFLLVALAFAAVALVTIRGLLDYDAPDDDDDDDADDDQDDGPTLDAALPVGAHGAARGEDA